MSAPSFKSVRNLPGPRLARLIPVVPNEAHSVGVIQIDTQTGRLRKAGREAWDREEVYTVAYSGGFTEDTMPEDIKLIALRQIGIAFNELDGRRLGVARQDLDAPLGGGSTVHFATSLSWIEASILSHYKLDR